MRQRVWKNRRLSCLRSVLCVTYRFLHLINKMDREANDPFELLDEIESVLGISTCPVNWPIGCGKEFKGVYDRNTKDGFPYLKRQWTGTKRGWNEGNRHRWWCTAYGNWTGLFWQADGRYWTVGRCECGIWFRTGAGRKLNTGIFWFGADEFRCGNVLKAFSGHDNITAAKTFFNWGD